MKKQNSINKNLVFVVTVAVASLLWAATKMSQVALTNSTINSTPVGASTPSTGAFTTATASTSMLSPLFYGSQLLVTPQPFGFVAWVPQSGITEGSSIAYDNFAGGETDYINQSGSLAGGFNWYNTNAGITAGSPLMRLNSSGTLTTTTFNGNLTGNANTASALSTSSPGQCSAGFFPSGITDTGNALNCADNISGNANTASSTTGNSATATQLLTTPTTCGPQRAANGVGINGNAVSCGPQILYGSNSSVCTTPAGAGSPSNICTTNVTWTNGSFSSSYIATCTGLNASGVTAPIIYITGQSNTFVTVSLMSGTSSQGGSATYGSISCIGMQP